MGILFAETLRKLRTERGLSVLEQTMPNATVIGFTRPSEALEYARSNRVALAFLDIELGKMNELEAWNTGASGFMLKPITPEGVQAQLRNLRYPFHGGVGR